MTCCEGEKLAEPQVSHGFGSVTSPWQQGQHGGHGEDLWSQHGCHDARARPRFDRWTRGQLRPDLRLRPLRGQEIQTAQKMKRPVLDPVPKNRFTNVQH